MSTSTPKYSNKVVDIFTGKPLSALENERIIRLSPEHDGLCMLYSNVKTTQEKLYTMKILCWAIRNNGDVVGMVPWLDKILPCTDLNDPYYGQFEGYYDLASGGIFFDAPVHKAVELDNAVEYFEPLSNNPSDIIQEIPDSIGTHAMLDSDDEHSLILTEVLSWRLLTDGQLQAMLVNEDEVEVTPVLPGDPCLYPAEDNSQFRYFFQHHIANQIKAENPEALAAIARLFEH
jgi:hypothetical protein